MGYETSFHLINVTIAPALRGRAESLLEAERRSRNENLASICRRVGFTSDGTLEFRNKALRGMVRTEVPDDEGFVRSAAGKWHGAEDFALVLCRAGFSGSIIQHSWEGDGAAFGWEFKAGRIRVLELVPVTRWRRLSPSGRQRTSKKA